MKVLQNYHDSGNSEVQPKLYLCVKGVELQLVGALERLGVDLLEGDPVELALEDVDLLHVVLLASYKVTFPRQRQLRVFRSLKLKIDIRKKCLILNTLVASFFSVLSKTRKGIQSL